MLSRTAPTPVNGYSVNSQLAPPAPVGSGPQSETVLVHQHIQEIANKRISTLDYLRKSYVAGYLRYDKGEKEEEEEKPA